MTTTNDTNSTQHLAVPRMIEIEHVTFFLSREGALSLDEREGRRPLVKLTPRETYAVLTFMRLPGVAELIEQAEAARQEQQWRDYEPDPETIAEQDAGR